MLKRFGLMLGAVMALALAVAAVAAPVDVTHTILVASASASPSEVAAGLMMAAGVLAVPVAEKAELGSPTAQRVGVKALSDVEIEALVLAKGLTATRVTPAEVQAAITKDTYSVLENGRTTVCQLTLDNGFTVEGMSACVSKANFDEALGQGAARKKAEDTVWMLLAFRKQEALFAAATS